MELKQTPTADQILEIVREREIKIVKFLWLGKDLTSRAMATHVDFLEDSMKSGIGITRGMRSFNALDLLVRNGRFGPESSEFRIVPGVNTFACLPYAPASASVESHPSQL